MIEMKTGWLLYDEQDYAVNRMFVSHIQKKAKPLGIKLKLQLTEALCFPLTETPDFVISRQRNHTLSVKLEENNITVFNCARVCEICNHKRNTHQFLSGLPVMKTEFPKDGHKFVPVNIQFPLSRETGYWAWRGSRNRCKTQIRQLQAALDCIHPQPSIVQETASDAGKDLRIYVLFGHIIASVMRSAQSGIVSNFKLGGNVKLHTLTDNEIELAQKVIKRFNEHSAPLSFAGIDLLYHQGEVVVNEVEDVVGSRMLYQVSEMDIINRYIQEIAKRL